MLRLSERILGEWNSFKELSRLFYERFFENDLIAVDSDTRGTLVGILALLAAPGVFLPFMEFLQYTSLMPMPLWMTDLSCMPDKALYLAFSMCALGVVTVLEWDALLPDRRDFAVLRPLPVRTGTLFSAKVLALIRFWIIFTLAINGCCMIFFPLAVAQYGTLPQMLWFMRCHMVTIAAGSAFAFLFGVAVHAAAMTLLGPRLGRRCAPALQFVLISGYLIMFFATAAVVGKVLPGQNPPAFVMALPTMWFLGLYQRDLGWPQEHFALLADRAEWALLVGLAAALCAYALSYQRAVARAFDSADGVSASPGCGRRTLAWIANALIVRTPAQRASFHFVWQTLARSRGHRVLLAAYAAAGVALVFQGALGFIAAGVPGWWENPRGVLLPVPLIMALFVLGGMRYVFTIPSELPANWVFQIAATGETRDYLAGVRKAALALGVVPLFVLLCPLYCWLWGVQKGGAHVLFGFLVSVLLTDLLLMNSEKLPFTCSYVAGKANLKMSWPLYILAYLVYVAALSAVDMLIMAHPLLLGPAAVLAGFVHWAMVIRRRPNPFGEPEFIYDERPEPAVRTLGLVQ